MSWLSDLPVQRKLGYAMLLTSTVASVVACGVFLAVEYVGYRSNIEHTVSTLSRITADNSTAAIAFSDRAGARQNLEALHAEPQIIAAILYDADGQIFARYNSQPGEVFPVVPPGATGVSFEKGYIIAVQPVMEGSRRLGTLHVQATMTQIYERMRTYSLIVLGVLASCFGMAGLIASVLRRTLARPILELAETASTVSANQDYSLRARQYGRDELGQLTVIFNAMLDRTQAAVDGLRESEWAHRELVRSLPTAAYMCDAQGALTIYNDAAVALWGRSPEVGREYWCGSYRIYRPDGTPLTPEQSPMALALQTGRATRSEEIIVERPDGTRRDVRSHPELIRDTSGKVVGMVNMLVDITDQKKAGAAERRLAAIVASSDDAIVSKNLDGIITSWNRGAELTFGYTAEEAIGQPVLMLIAPDRQKEEADILARIRRGDHVEHFDTVRQHRSGAPVHVSVTVSPIRNAEGVIIGASKIARNITDRKRAEQQVDFLSRLNHQLSALADPAEIIGVASRAMGQLLGADRCYFCHLLDGGTRVVIADDWAREGFASISGPHLAADFGPPELWRAMGAGPLAIDDRATHPLTRNQAIGYDALHVQAYASVPFLREGTWIASLAVTSETARQWHKAELDLLESVLNRVWPMVERARAQRELRESERRQRELLRALPVPCYMVDIQGRLVLFNDAATKLWGRVPELGEMAWCGATAMTDLKGTLLTPEQSPVALALLERRPVRGTEGFVVRPDGGRRWVVHHPDPVFDAQGNCLGVVDVIMDVTEERTAQEKVQKVAERLSLAISAGSLGDWNWEADSDVIMLSPRTSEIYGVASTAGLTRTSMRELLHPDDREMSRLALQKAMADRTDYDVEYRVMRPDGGLRWVAAKGRSFCGSDGKIRGMVGVVQDITERKQHAESLQALAHKIESQARLFDATLSNLTDLAYAFDRSGRFIFANKPLLELWGRSLEEIVGKNTFDLGYPQELAERIQSQVQEVIATRHAVRGETVFTGADGKLDDHEYIYNPVIAPDGSVSAVVGSTRLITERKRAEETLRQNEAQLRLVTDNAPVLLVRTDREHRFIFVNRAYAERNGRKPADLIGLKVEDVVGATAYASFRHHMDQALAGERVEFEMEVPYEKLGRRWIHVIYVPEREADGTINGLLAVITDIGERKQAENELKRARDEAVAASRAKDDFLAALSHELRTPLNPVLLLASDAASNPELPARIRADFDFILKNVNLEARLIDDLLDLTRITRGKLRLQLRRCNVHAILEDALSNVEAELAEKKLQLNVDFGAKSSRIQGDSVRLQQVFWNVLKNAVKFTPEGGRISVSTSLKDDGRVLVLKVADSGIGMTSDEIGRVFQAFSQGDHAAAGTGIHRFGGLGLGLTISKMLVELHEGRIEAHSGGRDQGSAFQIEFPLAAPEVSAGAGATPLDGAGETMPPFVPTPAPARASAPAQRRRILLVEDHAPTRHTLQHLLKLRHFEVMVAESATVAHRLAETNEFDLIISDVGLPDRNGYELMTELRAMKPHLPGIALSGYGMEDDVARSHAAGFHAHLVKPVTIGMLEDAIASLPTPSKPD